MNLLIVPNVRNPAAISAAQELSTWLLEQGVEPVLSEGDADACGLRELACDSPQSSEPDMVVALGGDGTILKAVHLIGDREVPLVGINMGRLGFMTAAGPGRMCQSVESALAGDVRIERRAALRAEVFSEETSLGTFRALNEVFIGRRALGRVVGLDLAVNGQLVQRVRGDGMIVATATGSTAYALSAGGPILAPETGGLLVVAVAPHTVCQRSILTSPSDTVEVAASEHARSAACVTVDGDEIMFEAAPTRVVATRHEHDVLLARVDGSDFYSAVAREFFGG